MLYGYRKVNTLCISMCIEFINMINYLCVVFHMVSEPDSLGNLVPSPASSDLLLVSPETIMNLSKIKVPDLVKLVGASNYPVWAYHMKRLLRR
jgi:hypothetical protein